MSDSDDVWNSILGKVHGHYLASRHLPASCRDCGELLIPVEWGVDPFLNERLWITRCCGNTERYIEEIIPKLQ